MGHQWSHSVRTCTGAPGWPGPRWEPSLMDCEPQPIELHELGDQRKVRQRCPSAEHVGQRRTKADIDQSNLLDYWLKRGHLLPWERPSRRLACPHLRASPPLGRRFALQFARLQNVCLLCLFVLLRTYTCWNEQLLFVIINTILLSQTAGSEIFCSHN